MQKLLNKIKLTNLLLLILSAFSIAFPAESQKRNPMKIELGQGYNNDRVKIYLDKKLVYNKQVSTKDSVQISDSFTVTKPKKAFTITVEINGSRFEKSAPKQTQELDKEDYSLLIDYDREAEEVDIKRKIVIVLYD